MEKPRLTTRIFGIGLFKTGTRSLRRALQMLGLSTDKRHTPGWMDLLGRLNAIMVPFCPHDIPALLTVYPDNKYIFTNRDFDSWLRSAKSHFANKPFAPGYHMVRARAFGAVYPSVEQLTCAYDESQEMLADLRRRDIALLEMDIIAGDGWEKLCPFLHLPVRTDPFPWEGKTPWPDEG